MDKGTTNSANPVVGDYGFFELPAVVEGHRTFVAKALGSRYANRKGDEYVLILHKNKAEHFIMGVYTDLKEALQTRYVTNLVLNGGNKFDENMMMMVHHIDGGKPVVDQFFDVETDTVKEYEAPEDEEETPPPPSKIIQP